MQEAEDRKKLMKHQGLSIMIIKQQMILTLWYKIYWHVYVLSIMLKYYGNDVSGDERICLHVD